MKKIIDIHSSQFHENEIVKLNEKLITLPETPLEKLLDPSGILHTDKTRKLSPIMGIDFIVRERGVTYQKDQMHVIEPNQIPLKGTEWVKVKPNTSLNHARTLFGSDLLFYKSSWDQQKFTIFLWDVFTEDQRSVSILVRKDT